MVMRTAHTRTGSTPKSTPRALSPTLMLWSSRPELISRGAGSDAKENAMKCPKVLLVAAGLMIFAPVNALAGDVKVIANASVKADTISAAELKRVFLEEKISLADGTHVEPVLQKGGPTHAAFLQEYLGRSE